MLMVLSTLPAIKAAVDPATIAGLKVLLPSTDTVRPLLRLHAGMLAALYPWLVTVRDDLGTLDYAIGQSRLKPPAKPYH